MVFPTFGKKGGTHIYVFKRKAGALRQEDAIFTLFTGAKAMGVRPSSVSAGSTRRCARMGRYERGGAWCGENHWRGDVRIPSLSKGGETWTDFFHLA